MKRMKTLKASALKVLFGMAVLCTVMFTACPNAAGGGGSAYVQVAYTALDTYLANTASADKVNYIEVTGISKDGLAGKVEGSNAEAGELGKKIKAHPAKQVALKLPGEVEGLDSMFACFFGCTNLVSLAGIPATVTNMQGCFSGCTSLTEAPYIPKSVKDMAYCFARCTSLTKAPVIPASVTNMESCFSGCTSLTESPVIPSKVTDMSWCFKGCTSLTQGPDIPASVKDMWWCFYGCTALKRVKLHCDYNTEDIGSEKAFEGLFENCTALEAGGVQVPTAFYNNYTADEALNIMKVPGDDEAAKKAKFSKF